MASRCSIRFMMLIAAALLLLNDASAQEVTVKKGDVPKAVIAAFTKAYPKAIVKGFVREVENDEVTYEIESVEGDMHRDATYLASGKLVSVEETIPFDEIPEEVRIALSESRPDATIVIAEKVTKGETILYEFLVQSGETKEELVYSSSGTLVKQEAKPEDNQER